MFELIEINNDEDFKRFEGFLPTEMNMIEINAKNTEEFMERIKSYCSRANKCYIVAYNNDVYGIFGIRDEKEKVGIAWMLMGVIEKEKAFEFIKFTLDFFDKLKKEYIELRNYTHADNLKSHKWLKLLGFKILYDEPVTIYNGDKAYPFIWRSE